MNRSDEVPDLPRIITIVVVDDEETVLDLMTEVLTDLGYRVMPATRGDLALAIMASTPEIDLLITDIRMPGMSGIDLAKAIRTTRPDLPILFVTGFAAELQGGMRHVVDDAQLLVKPFTMERFANKVGELVAASR